MRVVATVQEIMEVRSKWKERMGSGKVGLVPTMGYLHEGHLSLVRQARAENDMLMASIFINPTQFGPHEDLGSYPRNLSRDLQLLEELGVDVVFAPSIEEIYPPGFATYVEPVGLLATEAEGAYRPGHFRGVATVVLKLFHIVQPQQAYFGQKDAQQVVVISRMVADLNLRVTLRILPTIREADGLAISSRNSYLYPEEREAARVLYRALQAGRQAFVRGGTAGTQSEVAQAMADTVAREPRVKLDYAEVRDPNSFILLETLQPPALLVIAAQVGTTRLIDNFLLRADGIWDTGMGEGHAISSPSVGE